MKRFFSFFLSALTGLLMGWLGNLILISTIKLIVSL